MASFFVPAEKKHWTFLLLSGFWLIFVQRGRTAPETEHSRNQPTAGPGNSNVGVLFSWMPAPLLSVLQTTDSETSFQLPSSCTIRIETGRSLETSFCRSNSPTITNTKHHCFIKQVEKVTSQIEQCIICIETDLLHMCVQVLRAMLGLQVTEEQLQSIAERAIQEADLNSDGAISFDEFKKVTRRKSLKPSENSSLIFGFFVVTGESGHWAQDEHPLPEMTTKDPRSRLRGFSSSPKLYKTFTWRNSWKC